MSFLIAGPVCTFFALFFSNFLIVCCIKGKSIENSTPDLFNDNAGFVIAGCSILEIIKCSPEFNNPFNTKLSDSEPLPVK